MPTNRIDLDKLLRFFRDTYSHALTLQQMMEEHPEWKATEEEYNFLRATNDVHTAQKFEIFFQSVNDPEGFGKAVRAFLDTQPKTGRVQ
jgi:hypothetical protein